MAITPLGGRLIVKRLEEPDETPRGIVIPEMAKQGPIQRAQVIAVHDGIRNGVALIPCSVKVGDIVYLARNGGVVIYDYVSNTQLTLVHENELYGIESDTPLPN